MNRGSASRPRRVLLATDGSAASRAAVLAVASLARQAPIDVLVVHVQHVGAYSTETDEAAGELVAGVADDLSAFDIPARAEIRRGSGSAVASEILMASSQLDSHLVVLGSRRPSEVGGLLFGSVAREVISQAHCPVLSVRASRRSVARRRRVLLALAGDEDFQAVTSAILWLLEPSAEVAVWHGKRGPESGAAVSARVGQTVESFRSVGFAARSWVEPEVLGVPDDIKYAAELFAADLVVVGSRRISELSAFLHGSVSRRVAHLTDLPMLVVPTVP